MLTIDEAIQRLETAIKQRTPKVTIESMTALNDPLRTALGAMDGAFLAGLRTALGIIRGEAIDMTHPDGVADDGAVAKRNKAERS